MRVMERAMSYSAVFPHLPMAAEIKYDHRYTK